MSKYGVEFDYAISIAPNLKPMKFKLKLKPIDFQAQFQGAESGLDLIPQAIQVKVRCGFSRTSL